MPNINEPINPFNPDEEHDALNGRWFGQRALQAIALGGFGFAAYKMKGPAGKLVQKYMDRQRNSEIAKDMLKYTDSQDYLLGNDYSVRPPHFGIPDIDLGDPNIIAPEILDEGYPSTASAKTSLEKLESIEDSMLKRTNKDIAFSHGALPRSRIDKGPIQPAKEIDIGDSDDIFWSLRKETLFEYLNKNTPMDGNDYSELASMSTKVSDADKKALGEKHRMYAHSYPEYYELYKRKLAKANRKYKSEYDAYLANKANSGRVIQESEAKKWLFGAQDMSDDPALPIDMKFNSKRKNIATVPNVRELIRTGGSITSGSLDKTVSINPDSPFRYLGQFDYYPLLKKISDRVEDLKTNRAADLGIQDINYEIIAKGTQKRPQYHYRLTFHFQGKRPLTVEAPLAQWGVVPGSTPGVTNRVDRAYELPNGVRNVYRKVSLDINKDFENTTQKGLRELLKGIDSAIMNEARSDPIEAVKKLQRSVNNAIQQAPISERTTSDAIKALILQPSFHKKELSANRLRVLDDAVATGYNIRRMSNILSDRGKAINIELDFEAIAPDVGPQHMARSKDTQLTKAGILVSDISNGKVRNVGGQEIVSDHGVEIVKNIGVSEKTANWVSREIDESVRKDIQSQGPEAVFEFWSENVLKQEAKDYVTKRRGRKFKNNVDFAEHVGEQILKTLDRAKQSGKEVFITTKNGNMFDLHLLKRFAPIAWAKIQKHHRHMIDLQSIEYFRQYGFGGDESLSLNKLIMNIQKKIDPNTVPIDIDSKGGLSRALRWFNSQKGHRISPESFSDSLAKQGINLASAHSTPLGDDMATMHLLLHNVHEYRRGDKVFGELDELQRFLTNHKKILGLDESLQRYKAMESRYTIYGRIASASLLSQGNIQDELVSAFTPDQLFPFPDNKLSKQWYQLEKGHANKLSTDNFTQMFKTDLERRQAYKKNFVPSIVTQGKLHAEDYLRKVGDDTAAMSHQMMVDTLFVWNPYRGKEGFQSWSSDVFKMREFHFDRTVPLNPNAYINDPKIHKRLVDFQRDVNAKARALMDAEKLKGDVPADIIETAARQIMADEKFRPIKFGPGSTIIAEGERGAETIKTEIGGEVYDVFSSENAAGDIKMYAKVRYIAEGKDIESLAARARSIGGKGVVGIDRFLSLGVAKGGPQAVVTADFFHKGYLGAMKTLVAEQIKDKLDGVISDPNSTKSEIDNAVKAKKKFMSTLNAYENSQGTLVTKERDISGMLKNIKDPTLKAKAKLFVGGIDLNAETMLNHMKEAGLNWTLDDAERYYSRFGGKERVTRDVEDAITKAQESIRKGIDVKGGALEGLNPRTRDNMQRDIGILLRSFLLPNVEKIKSGEAIPTAFAFHKEYAAMPDSGYQFGLRSRTATDLYGLMKGMQADTKNIKLRGDLLKMIDIPGAALNKETLRTIKDNVNAANSKKFFRAAQTVQNFKNALLSSSFTSGAELSLEDINTITDRIGNIDLKKLKNKIQSGEELDAFTKRAVDLLDEARDSGDLGAYVISLTEDIKASDVISAFKKNKGFVTISAVSRVVDLANKKGGVFAYSAKEELGGAFTFNIKDIVNLGIKMTDEPETVDRVMEFFTRLSKRPDSIVESIDPTNYTVKLNKLIFHADMTPENIYNSLNPKGQEATLGIFNNAAMKRQNAITAIKEMEEVFAKAGETKDIPGLFESKEKVKAQYIKYLLDGFLLDSESVYKRAFDFGPAGMYSTIAGAEGIFSRAVQIHRRGNLSSFIGVDPELGKLSTKSLENADRAIKDIVHGTSLNDVFVTKSFFEGMKVRQGSKQVSIRESLRNVFGDPQKADEIYEAMAEGRIKVPAFGVANPTYPNAVDAALDLNLKVVPDEVAPYLGMNANVMNVFAEIARIHARDFDGDQTFAAYKPLKKAEHLMQWQSEHRQQLDNIMSRLDIQAQMVTDDKGIKRLGFATDHFIEGGEVVKMGFDERGRAVHSVVTAEGSEFGDVVAKMTDLANKQTMHNPAHITPRYISDRMSELGQVGVSKDNIGLFTNIYRKRVSQVLQAGVIKDPLDKAFLIGNTHMGLGKLAQDIISLAKHGTGIDEIAKVAKVFSNSYESSADAHRASDDYVIKSFESIDLPMEHRKRLLQGYRDSISVSENIGRQQDIRSSVRSLANLDLGRSTANALDLIISNEAIDNTSRAMGFSTTHNSVYRELGDSLKKKFKIQPEFPKSFARKAGKYGLVGAAAYLALNFFKPAQISSSWNPMDAFTDLGVDFNGDYNYMGSPELPGGVPLDTVDASFSKQAYIKLKGARYGNNKEDKSKVVSNLLKDTFSGYDSFVLDFKKPQNVRYSNYTQRFGSFGNNTLYRRSQLL